MAGRVKEINLRYFTPRDYQLELLSRALDHNAIVTLGTGAGKTFIAVLLIKEYAFQLLEAGKKAIFVVDKVALVGQQAEHIECHCSLAVGRVHGNTNKAWWSSRDDFSKFIQQYNVLVITAQIFLDLLNHAFFDVRSTALLVLDECHHSLGARHPYRLILEHYQKSPNGRDVRIVGLTASVLNKRVELSKLETVIRKLEKVMHSRLEVINDLTAVMKYCAKPTQLVVMCRDDEPTEQPAVEILRKLMDFVNHSEFSQLEIDPRPPIREAIKRTRSVLEHVGQWAAWKSAVMWQKRMAKFLDDPHLGDKQKRLLGMAETSFRTCVKILANKASCANSLKSLRPYIKSRMVKVLDLLLKGHGEFSTTQRGSKGPAPQSRDHHLSALLFVDQRCIAYVISILLKSLSKWEPREWGFLRADFVVGHSRMFIDTDEAMAIHRRQEQILSKFRTGAINLLVSTNVLEEGIDVRNCNLVIRYDPPHDFRSFIQSRGRARKEGGIFAIMVGESNYAKVESDIRLYSQIEEFLMRRFDWRRDASLPAASADDVDEVVLESLDTFFKPYVVESTGAQVSMSTAIALINRYCSKLPSDVFTRLVPQSRTYLVHRADGTAAYQAELELPINSPLKHTVRLDDPELMPKKSLALMAVALKACIRLHEQKELNDHLLPMGKDTVANLLSEVEDDEDLPYLPNKVGSSKRKRLYDRKMSKSLTGTLPKVGEPCYIYVIEMKLVKSIGEEGNPKKRRILDPAEVDSCFGLLSTRALPNIPGFPVFQRQGEVEVRIRKAASMLLLDERLMGLVCLFHRHIFDDILKLGRGGLDFSPDHSPIPLLVVPLRRSADAPDDHTIDYRYLNEDIRRPPCQPDDETRRKFKFDENNFLETVVCPWYRCSDQLAYYYVAEICRDQRPSSKFPDEKFKSFNEYFMTKYQLEIYDQNQNLLDVDHTSARMNLLLPRVSHSKKKCLDLSQRQVLVPELVYVHPLSAPLWSMIIALPTVLYRLNSLLLVNELRATVMREALGVDVEMPPEDFEWDALKYATPNSDESQKPIRNLEQLKRATEAAASTTAHTASTEQESVEQQTRDADDVEDKEPERGTFEIGVWDPLADGARLTSIISSSSEERKGGDSARGSIGLRSFDIDEISENIGMGSQHSIHNYSTAMSDDEEEGEGEDYDFFFDFKKTMHEKLAYLSQNALQNGVHTDEQGWEGGSGLQPVNSESDKCPLSICSSGGINVAALMKDLEMGFAGNVYAHDVGASTAPVPGWTGREAGAAVAAVNQPKSEGQRKKMYLDAMEQLDDELPARRDLESVDLLEFDEGVDEGTASEHNVFSALPAEQSDQTTEGAKLDAINSLLCTADKIGEVATQSFKVLAPKLPPMSFSFEKDLLGENAYGASPTLLLQALTTSSASDGINLERLETVGDSFLKLAVTNYLYHKHPDQHEGKLSYARSKEVSNSRLFLLGQKKCIPFLMEASKFDPHVNWLPPAYASTSEFHALNPIDMDIDDGELSTPTTHAGGPTHGLQQPHSGVSDESKKKNAKGAETGWGEVDDQGKAYKLENGVEVIVLNQTPKSGGAGESELPPLPYNMMTQQYISDKSIADAVESLIGAHLLELGPRATLRFMSWLGIKVLTEPMKPQAPLLRFIDTEKEPNRSLEQLFILYKQFKFPEVEHSLGYVFGNKAYLVQAFTHASYYKNRVTGCYQRLEFLGDAVLDYLITRYLFEHRKQYSPGVLTDLRSALVNNTIFASMAVKLGFQRHFIALCPGLHHMIEKFVNLCKSRGDNFHCTNFNDEMFMITEDEIDEGHEEDIEVPKALGDIFESVAGAVYLDCGTDLDVVWRVFYNIMRESIEECCRNPPQSPIRELFERKNCKARFTKLERILETGKVRVTVDVNDMRFVGMGRSYRIAKCTAAKRALKHLQSMQANNK